MYFCCCSKLVVFSGKFSKTVTGADRPKMAEISAPSNDTRTSLVKSAEGSTVFSILGDPGAVSRVAGIFVGESLTWAKVYCKNETNLWAITLTEPVPEAFEIPAFDCAENYFSAQSAKRTSRATLMPSYTTLFSSSIATVEWAFPPGRFGTRF